MIQIPVLRFKVKIKLLQGYRWLGVVRMYIGVSKFGSTVILLGQKWKPQWLENPSSLQETTNRNANPVTVSLGEGGQRNPGSLGGGETLAHPT